MHDETKKQLCEDIETGSHWHIFSESLDDDCIIVKRGCKMESMTVEEFKDNFIRIEI